MQKLELDDLRKAKGPPDYEIEIPIEVKREGGYKKLWLRRGYLWKNGDNDDLAGVVEIVTGDFRPIRLMKPRPALQE